MLSRLDPRMILKKRQQLVFLLEDLISLDHSIFVGTKDINIAFKWDIDLLDLQLGLGCTSWIDFSVIIKFLQQSFLTAISHEILYNLKGYP